MKNSHRMGGKLDATWKGPYTVSEFVGKGRYRLMRGDGKELKKLYNGVLLKEYIPLGSAPSQSPQRKKRKVFSILYTTKVILIGFCTPCSLFLQSPFLANHINLLYGLNHLT